MTFLVKASINNMRLISSDINCLMLKLSKRVDYGLMALMHLARHSDRSSWSAREIAQTYDIPSELLAKILQKMVQKGFLVSHHGTNGGYSLARAAGAISVLEVIEAIEGPLSITSCVSDHGLCVQFEKCSVKSPLQSLNDKVIQMLSQLTIAHMNQQWPSGLNSEFSKGGQITFPVLQG